MPPGVSLQCVHFESFYTLYNENESQESKRECQGSLIAENKASKKSTLCKTDMVTTNMKCLPPCVSKMLIVTVCIVEGSLLFIRTKEIAES
jgi:hypothetical protein